MDIQPKKQLSKIFSILSGSAIGLITIGVLFYHFVEKFTWVDAWYFTIITLTTVGYGDIHPTTDIGKIFTSVYVLLWVGIIGVFLANASQHRMEKSHKFLEREGK